MVISESPTHLELMRWGLVPFWSKDGKGIINVRAETVAEKPAFKQSLRFRRCLVPACGFFEWKRTEQGKVPYRIHLKDSPLFAFAGIYNAWTNPQGEDISTYAIITTQPNALMEEIHNRMPVILREEDEGTWLDGLSVGGGDGNLAGRRLLSPHAHKFLPAPSQTAPRGRPEAPRGRIAGLWSRTRSPRPPLMPHAGCRTPCERRTVGRWLARGRSEARWSRSRTRTARGDTRELIALPALKQCPGCRRMDFLILEQSLDLRQAIADRDDDSSRSGFLDTNMLQSVPRG